ncbi:unnamed protein product, partial [Symbiodinium microadriaticum]
MLVYAGIGGFELVQGAAEFSQAVPGLQCPFRIARLQRTGVRFFNTLSAPHWKRTRLLLNHEQGVSQELKAQVRDERRRRELLQREMQDKLELQDHEMKRLLAELETAKAALQQKKNEFHQRLEETSENPSKMQRPGLKQRQCETELLAALLEHATKQATACPAVKTESTALQQLRSELEVAQGKASEAQEAAEELP